MARMDNATGWRRRALRLVELCKRLGAEHVLCKAMRRWPVAALLEATEGWGTDLFAAVSRDWRLNKVARLLEAKGRAFTVECCEEWEPEYLQVLLPQLDVVTARHVLGHLYFKSDDKHLSAWECRCILEQFNARAQVKLVRKFEDRDVARVLHATESDDDEDDEDDDEGEEEDSMDGFIVEDGEEGEEEEVEGEEDQEEDMARGKKVKSADEEDGCGEEAEESEDGEAEESEDGEEESEDSEDGQQGYELDSEELKAFWKSCTEPVSSRGEDEEDGAEEEDESEDDEGQGDSDEEAVEVADEDVEEGEEPDEADMEELRLMIGARMAARQGALISKMTKDAARAAKKAKKEAKKGDSSKGSQDQAGKRKSPGGHRGSGMEGKAAKRQRVEA